MGTLPELFRPAGEMPSSVDDDIFAEGAGVESLTKTQQAAAPPVAQRKIVSARVLYADDGRKYGLKPPASDWQGPFQGRRGGTYWLPPKQVAKTTPEQKAELGVEGEAQPSQAEVLAHAALACTREPDNSIQCHQGTAELAEKFGDKGFRPVYWPEEKWTEIAAALDPKAAAKSFAEPRIIELIEDIKDGSVNGHSFGKIGDTYIDPYLWSVGVSNEAIQRFGAYLESLYAHAQQSAAPSAAQRKIISAAALYGKCKFGDPTDSDRDMGGQTK